MEQIGRYEIIRELGRGAMGVVYHARDPKIGREIAIKTIKLADQADASEVENLRERLFREAQSAGRLSHPGIVTIYDIDEVEGLAYITMEFVQGSTLEEILQRGRIEDLAFSSDVVRQTAAALDYAHAKGIVHRDIKPANLMLTPDGVVKIMDFGIARISSSQLTQTGTVMGTPSYMSPEQVRGLELDGRSDQFSLGVIAYEMLTGRKPFRGENLTSVIFKIVSEPPKRVGDICPWVSPELDHAVVKALSKSADDRFEDCKSFSEAFADGVEGALTDADAARASQPTGPDESTGADLTAPAMTAYPPPPGSQGSERDSTLADATMPPPPTSSSGGTRETAEADRSLPPLTAGMPSRTTRATSAAPPPDEDSGGMWKTALIVAAVALVLGVGAIFALNPWIFEDPERTLRAVGLGGDPIDPAEQVAPLEPPDSPAFDAANPDAGDDNATSADEPPEDEAPADAGGAETAATASAGGSPPAGRSTAAASRAAEAPEPAPKPAEEPAPAKPAPRPAASSNRFSTASVYFRTNQVGATVTVDNRAEWECRTPCRINDLPAGRHRVVARLDGFHTTSREFELGDQQQEIIELNLEDARVTVLITSEPPGGEIYIDGRRIPQKTNARVPMPEGTYEIRVVKDGQSAEQVLRVNRDEIPFARFTFE